MIEIDDGFFVDPYSVTVVKAGGKKRCVIFVTGQSALDGFVINRPALEVATDIVEELQEDSEEDNEGSEKEEE